MWGIADGANGNGVGQQQGRPVRTIERTGRDPSVPGLDSLSAFLSARLKEFCYSFALTPIYFNLLFQPLLLAPVPVRAASRLPAIEPSTHLRPCVPS